MLYSSVSFDLSPLFGFIGEKIVAAMKVPPKRSVHAGTLNTVKIQGTIAFSRYNAIAPISIPPEAKKRAPADTKPRSNPTRLRRPNPGPCRPPSSRRRALRPLRPTGIGTEQGTPGTQADFSQNTMSAHNCAKPGRSTDRPFYFFGDRVKPFTS
jgi:hypothetical protein